MKAATLLNGCKWQEKSFTVAAQDKFDTICNDCKKPCSSVYKYNGDTVCHGCFTNRPSIKSGFSGEFYTTRDKLFEFIDENTTGKPIEFRTKGQWQRHLKKIGQHDDTKQKRTRSEIMNSILEKSKFKPIPREERTKMLLSIYDKIRRR